MKTYLRSQATHFHTLGEDVVALNVENGFCYGMENVTADVWAALSEPHTLDSLCQKLAAKYDMSEPQTRQDVSDLLDQMVDEGIVQTVE